MNPILTGIPVTSQYLLCGLMDGGASTLISEQDKIHLRSLILTVWSRCSLHTVNNLLGILPLLALPFRLDGILGIFPVKQFRDLSL